MMTSETESNVRKLTPQETAQSILGSIQEPHGSKKQKKELSFSNLVQVQNVIMRFKKKITKNFLTTEELADAHSNFELLKFADYEENVHYKVLGRNMHRLRIFLNLEAAVDFCENLIPGSHFISFEDLLTASRSDDIAIRDVILAYLRRLATNSVPDSPIQPKAFSEIPSLPKINPHDSKSKPSAGNRNMLFSNKIFGNQARLSLIPRQKQTIVRQDSDHLNLSIRARPKPEIRKTEAAYITNDNNHSPHSHRQHHHQNHRHQQQQQQSEVSISSRIRNGLQRCESGYSYREQEGGKVRSAGLKIISHDSRLISDEIIDF